MRDFGGAYLHLTPEGVPAYVSTNPSGCVPFRAWDVEARTGFDRVLIPEQHQGVPETGRERKSPDKQCVAVDEEI